MRLVQVNTLKILQKVSQPCVFLFRLAQIGTIKADVAENAAAVLAAHLLAVGFLEVGQCFVNQFANVG